MTVAMTVEKKRYDFLLEAMTPIAHHAETLGNTAILMRRKVRLPTGEFVTVPIITADTMRHGLREAGAETLREVAGLAPQFDEGALRLLYAGGMMTGRGDGGTVNLDNYRKLCEMVPHMALMGGCASNRVIPGRMQVQDALLVCEETLHLVPQWVRDALAARGAITAPARSHVDEEQRVRMDPTLDPGKRKLLTAGAEGAIEQRLLASEKAHERGDERGMDEAKSSMMPRRAEVLAPGSLFYWSVSCACFDALEIDTLNVLVTAFLGAAMVGGKKGTGHGALRVVEARDLKVLNPERAAESMDLVAMTPRVGALYAAHLRERGPQITEFLRGVDA